MVDAASYRGTLAPDALATIFGTGLARSTASATLDSAGQLPVELAATRVEVNGEAASLLYVSPTQINFVVPGGIAAGATTLTVRSTDSSNTRAATIPIAAGAPALFSSDASGKGPGAILNAVTFTGAPFLVETPENGGDNRTRLALYGTGVRHAREVIAAATDSRGQQTELTVEYAGAAPGYFGLDQINVVLPRNLDGAGTVSLRVTADNAASNTVTAQIAALPASRLHLDEITLDPNFVLAGDPMTATVYLNGVARSGGWTVSLRSTNLAVQPPASVTIPEGSASAQTTIATSPVISTQTGSVEASSQGVTRSAPFQVDPANTARLSSLSLSATSVLGGREVVGTVRLTAPAPGGGLNILVASDNAAVRPPGSVNVGFNQRSATFSITTSAVTGTVNATLTATLSRISVTTSLKLLPPLSLTVDSDSVIGGNNITGTVTLGEPAPAGGAVIQLASSDRSTVMPPFQVSIGAGATKANFTITTTTVTSSRTATVTATYFGLIQSVAISVNPPAPLTISGFTISPATVTGGNSAQGVVTLNGPAGFGGQRIDLSSTSLLTAQVPGFVTVPQGFTTAQFTINTTSVVTPQSVTVTASMGAATRTAVLTVQ